jgi:hypothetical protein
MTPLWQQAAIVRQSQLILNSYRRWLGRELIERSGDEIDEAQRLFEAEFVVLSHGVEEDPVLNYGNATALALWEMNFEHFTQTPSRLTAAPDQREERARLLQRTALVGYIDDYQGVRITRSGRRLQIQQATVWNLLDEAENIAGQAATFGEYEMLKDNIGERGT